jgi:hypothetical protein
MSTHHGTIRCGIPICPSESNPYRAGVKYSAANGWVGPFGRCYVQYRIYQALFHKAFHGLAISSGGVAVHLAQGLLQNWLNTKILLKPKNFLSSLIFAIR